MAPRAPTDLEFSFPLVVVDLPSKGGVYDISTDAGERARVAQRLGLQAVASLTGHFDVLPAPGGIVRVEGHIDAQVVQTCVVSLAPVPATIHEDVSVRFLDAPADKARQGATPEEVVALEDEEPPEIALGGQFDLGEVAVTQMALALDPYPKAPGAVFKTGPGVEPERASPFAVLAKLKKPKGS